MRNSVISICRFACIALWLIQTPPPEDNRRAASADLLSRQFSHGARLPVYFIENRGQADALVRYFVQSPATTVAFTHDSIYYTLRRDRPVTGLHYRNASLGEEPAVTGWTVALHLIDVNPGLVIEPEERTEAVLNYFRGSPESWITGVPAYAQVVYRNVWPGIDLRFSGADGNLKYTFFLKPFADPSRIRMAYQGATAVSLSVNGRLHIETPNGGFSEDVPVAWQEEGSERQPVSASFVLKGDELGFSVGAYDRTRELVVDPLVMVYSGYIGGTSTDEGWAIAVDAAGNAYVAGHTESTQSSFPVTVGPDSTKGGDFDAFVAKINSAGTGLVYAGYIGGTAREHGYGITVDSSGAAYVVGDTTSSQSSFPVTSGPDTTHNGNSDAFIAKVSASGTSLVYAGFVGGTDIDKAWAVGVDGGGNAYVAGETYSGAASFPETAGLDMSYNGAGDGFVAKVSANGLSLSYATYFGGAGFDAIYGIAVDSGGNAYVSGTTNSSEATFPVAGGPDTTHNGLNDAFVAKLDSSAGLEYSGYVGGSLSDYSRAVAIDGAGNAYIAGWTTSNESTFPVLIGPDLTYNGGANDAFVAKVDSTGSNVEFCGYIGGAGLDQGQGVAVDGAGNVYVTGATDSTEGSFPVTVGPDLTANGGSDAFVAKVRARGDQLVFAGFLGGTGIDWGLAIALDAAGAVYLTGYTSSNQSSFPATAGPDLTFNGVDDAYVTKIASFPGTAGPTIALRNGFNAIETNTFPSRDLRNASGGFRLDPSLAMTSGGQAFMAGRDSGSGVWINFLKPDNTYNGWVFAGGNSPGQPALAVAGETSWIAVRDPWNSYYVRSYNPNFGFGAWTWLQGILATDPQIAGCPNGDVYVAGKDFWNGVWTRRYHAGTWQSWYFIGGIITGKPGLTCGADNAAYLAARDTWNNMWLARVVEETSSSWHYGEGLFDGDLHVAANGNLIHVAGLSSSVPWYRTWEIGSGWAGWQSPGGVLAHFTPAVYNNHIYLSGEDSDGNVWWWSSLSMSWSSLGDRNVAATSLFSGGYR